MMMRYRKDGKDKILGKLYTQPGLEEALALPPDLRPHFLSLVLTLPTGVSRRLTQKAIDWTNKWAENCFYVQRNDTLHITLLDLGKAHSHESTVQDFAARLEEFLVLRKHPSFSITLTEATIGSSGINCELLPGDGVDDFIRDIREAVQIGDAKNLVNRSISLVRYRARDDRERDSIRQSLRLLESLKPDDSKFGDTITLSELSMVRLDKVAQYFDVLHTFAV